MFDFESPQALPFLVSCWGLSVPNNESERVTLHLRPMGLLGLGGMSVVVRVQAVQLTGQPTNEYYVSSSMQEAAAATTPAAASSSGGAPRTFALKVMKRCSDLPLSHMLLDSELQTQVVSEWRALHACSNSPYIIKGHAVGWVTVSSGELRPCVLMDVAEGGSLESVVASSGALSHEQAWEVIKRMVRGLLALNKLANYVHRDLKLANILLLTPGDMTSAVLSDFGLSEHVPHPGAPCRRQVYTPGYQTPDVQPGRSHGAPVDIFLLGLLLVHMITGDLPFSYVPGNLNQQEVSRRTPQELDNPDCPYVRDRLITPAEKAFLQRTLATDPALRLTAIELICHPYTMRGPGALGDWPRGVGGQHVV
jgi:serine/threonine protein kinase